MVFVMKEINECTKIEDETSDLSQGDIFVYYDEDGNEAYGIIITGDCDISQNKCNGLITSCRIYSASYHIKNYILKEKCQKHLSILEGHIKSQLNTYGDFEANNNFFSDIMLLSPDELKTKIKPEYKEINQLIDKFAIYKRYISQTSFCIDDYKQIYLSMNKMTDERWKKQSDSMRLEIANSFKKLAGDLFYINNIPELEEVGFVVHLRQISTFKKSSFFLDEHKNKEIFRIAHLNTPYIHSLTQRVGAMFSDIGLSEDYELNRQEILTEVVKNI